MFKHQDLQMVGHKIKQIRVLFSQVLEVVCRGSETQLDVGENLNYWST